MTLTTEMPQQFHPNVAMIALADACYTAMAHESYVRGIVEPYRYKVLREREYRVDPAKLNQPAASLGQTEVITDIAHAYLMTEADFNIYHQRCMEERAKCGLTSVKPGNCPLSEAENVTRIAKAALVDCMAPVTGVTSAKLIEGSYQVYLEMTELVLNLFANHVSDAPEIVSRVKIGAGAVAPQPVVTN